ncbi:MAG TPA: MAPEG family protein [Sphingobium sp.]|nr:MAPEG family protein [Sphingobium sp.]
MANAINPTSIFMPMLVIVALTFVAFIRMAAARAAAVKGGQDPNYYRAHLGKPEPEATVAAVRHYTNLFELPVLFYAACLTAFVLGAVSGWTVAFAWAYVAARLLQSAVHMTYNNPAHRGLAFVLGVLFMFALWLNVALAIFAEA